MIFSRSFKNFKKVDTPEKNAPVMIELQKQKQASTIHASQLSHIEAALDSQAASFESEFETLNSHIKKLQEEKNSLYAKEMTLQKKTFSA